ncbi:protein singed wings 2 [Ceratina calcarata]|uniref:Protein singed wings 2 n=1 Tax=Ceratina calcarata TaxID=156304 RepID=A0AAJ7RZI2_9HYME|nr:protein singed wings 2 [Ceratina calcarata]
MWKISRYLLLITFIWLHLRFSSANSTEENCDLRQAKSNTSRTCDLKEHDQRLVCFHGLEDKWKSEGEYVRTLVLCYWPAETFDPQDVLQGFSSLKKLIIEKSNLTRLVSTFSNKSRSIEKLEIIETELKELPRGAFDDLLNLKILDVRNNSLQEIDVETFNIHSLHHVYLSGNPLKCSENTKWILDQGKGSLSHKITDKEHLRCTVPYDGRPLIPVVEIINTLKDECRKTVCDCELVYVLGNGGKHIQKQLTAFTSVNCSHRGLTEMPNFLPANTTTLRLSGNQITDVTPLTTNPVYEGVIDLYLDNNMIRSIVKLEGSSWVDRFRVLDLRGNKLNDLPTYALQNALQHNQNAVSLFLGKNPWQCDCFFTPGFQDLIIRYTNIVKDTNDVKCSLNNGDENSGKIIRDLKRTEICVSPEENILIHPLDVLNIILALLIFFIIGKLLYDYWCFKKTGKLPWIVTKIP